jgi:putative FmdB family regulatory protein
MPTYEYKCAACGHAFEKFQSIKASPIKKCPVCGKNKVQRLIGTGAGLIFKGSGFYITDYRSEGYKNAAKADSGSKDSGGADSGAKEGGGKESATKDSPAKSASDPKPAAKPAAKPAGKSEKK